MKVKEESEKASLKPNIQNQDHHFMANKWGNNGNSERLNFGGAPKSLQVVTAAMKLKNTCSLDEKLFQPIQYSKAETLFFQQTSI